MATITSSLAPLAGLACVLAVPLGMGAMLLMMIRGGKASRPQRSGGGYPTLASAASHAGEHERPSVATDESERDPSAVAFERQRR